MRKREDLIAAPDALNTNVIAWIPAVGPTPPIPIGNCAYFSIGVDSGFLAGPPYWWILFGSDPNMPTIDVKSSKPGTACYGPFQKVAEFWPVKGQRYFRITATAATGQTISYVRIYRSSVGR